jgi:hypothetical protein
VPLFLNKEKLKLLIAMGRQSVVEEGCTYDVVSDKEVPEGGWGWIAAFGLALMFVSTKEIY